MTDTSISPLRQRMIEDMTVRGFTAGTQRSYITAVRGFTAFFGRFPDQATAEDLRRYQLHMRSSGATATSMNAAVSALRFLFGVTLGRNDAETGMTTVRQPRKLAVILSPDEVARLLDAAPGLKHKAALSVAYGAGLRASEVISLKAGDIDSERMVIRVEQGNGRKDRYATAASAQKTKPQHNPACPQSPPCCVSHLGALRSAGPMDNLPQHPSGVLLLRRVV